MMKFRPYFLVVQLILVHSLLFAQDYRGENKVFFKFEKKDLTFSVYESDKMSIEVDRDQNSFFCEVDLETFSIYDSTTSAGLWRAVFNEGIHEDFAYKGSIPLMKLDVQSDRKQKVEVDGILHVGESKLEVPILIEWIQMDRFVFVDFNYKISLKELGITLSDEYAKEYTGNLYVEVLNGKLIGGFK
jgi:hypothetical protein